MVQDFNVTLSSLELGCLAYPQTTYFVGDEPLFMPIEFKNYTHAVSRLTAVFNPVWKNNLGEQPLPGFVQFDSRRMGFILSTDKPENVGKFSVGLRIFYSEHSYYQVDCLRSVEIAVLTKPTFEPKVEEVKPVI